MQLPKKRDFRMRAHINVLQETKFPYPKNPQYINYEQLFKSKSPSCNTIQYPCDFIKQYGQIFPDFIDLGCGYGGLLFKLQQAYPQKNILGMEIRDKLCNYINDKIIYYRNQEESFYNIAVQRTNSQRHFLQYIPKESLEKLFILFPDPNFKEKHKRRRILNHQFLQEYLFTLKTGGRIYAVTDVQELHEFHYNVLNSCKHLKQIKNEEVQLIDIILNSSEESMKVDKRTEKDKWNQKHYLVYEKIS